MLEDSGVAPNLLSLPSGGGGVGPLGERFEPDLVRGSGSYAVPLRLPKGPNEQVPSHALTYSTGSGNGPYGLGWRLDLPRVERRTDRGVPSYTDADQFTLADDTLVPVGDGRYRPRTDTRSWLITRAGDGWEVRPGDGRLLRLGTTAGSREASGGRVFAWYLDEERDAAGNSTTYSYRRDGDRLFLSGIGWSVFEALIAYEPRADVLRDGRAGFLRTTALRATRIDLYNGGPAPLRTYELGYASGASGVSLLVQVAVTAGEGAEAVTLPRLTFEYAGLDLGLWSVGELDAELAPPAIGDPAAQFADLTGDGVADVLRTGGGRAYLWRNSGGGTLEGPLPVPAIPSSLTLDRPRAGFADLDGDGRVDLFSGDRLSLMFEADGRGGFRPDPVVFAAAPALGVDDDGTRLVDVDGDGVTDILALARDHLLLSRHRPGVGWDDVEAVRRIPNPERFPDVALSDLGVRLADMTGDGLIDIVAVRGGEVVYWPSLGNGSFGPRVRMPDSPRLPPGYRDERLHLMDVSGDGCADLVYVDADRILVWLNRAGSGFGPPNEIPIGPPGGATVIPADLYGEGRPGLAWSISPGHAGGSGHRLLRFGDPLDRTRPGLLTAVETGMGGRYEIAYGTSAAMRRADRRAGRDWPGPLPVVVDVVAELAERDQVTGRVSARSFRYHDGVWDGTEREFRGFGRVTVHDPGDESVPAGRSELSFFQGDPETADPVERDRQRALSGALLSMTQYDVAGPARTVVTTEQTWRTRLEHDGPDGRVWFPYLETVTTREPGVAGDPARISRVTLSGYDAYGNARRRVSEHSAEDGAAAPTVRTDERFSYVEDTAAWLVRLPVRLELRDTGGTPLTVSVNHYDGAPFTGLAEGRAERGLLTRTVELALLDTALPDGYAEGRDLADLGYRHVPGDDTAGWYTTTMAVRRDARGNVVEHRDPLGAATTVEYDGDGLYPIVSVDPLGLRTEMEFDPRSGEPAVTRLPDGRTLRSEYDALGRLVAHLEDDDTGTPQLHTCWLPDTFSIPASTTAVAPRDPGRTRGEFRLDMDLGALPDVAVSRMYYDGFGQNIAQVATAPDAPDGTPRLVAASRQLLNSRHQPSVLLPSAFVTSLAFPSMIAPAAETTVYRYDTRGDKVAVTGPAPARFRVERDAFTLRHYEGERAGGHTPSRVERFDVRGNVIAVEEDRGDGHTVSTRYDLTDDGRLLAVRDGAGAELLRNVVAGPGAPIRVTHRSAGTRTYYRDAAKRLVETRKADGTRVLQSYDAGGRPVRTDVASVPGAPERLREMIYDRDPGRPSAGRFLAGRLAVAREGDVELRYSYDRAGHPVEEVVDAGGGALTLRRAYDLQGRLTALTYPDGRTLPYARDRAGAVSAVEGVAAAVSYDADRRLTGYTSANGVRVSMPRDPVSGRLAEVAARSGEVVLRRLTYAYDAIGNVTGIVDEAPERTEHQTYGYDGLYRLIRADIRDGGGVPHTAGYSYDDAGNLLARTGDRPLTLTYGDAARPDLVTGVAAGGAAVPVDHDDAANLRSYGSLTAAGYDGLDRMTFAATGGGDVEWAYDARGRRARKRVTADGEATTHYLGAYYERHADHGLRHVYLGDRMIATERHTANAPDAALHYMSDHHGTVLLATGDAGVVVAQQRYTPFGETLEADRPLNRYLGQEFDAETATVALGPRAYLPSLGRFGQPDWFVLENPSRPLRIPQGFNPYSYAINNPLALNDPSGLWFGFDDLAVAAVGFVVGFVSGLVYGLADGRGWDSFGLALETGFTTGAGAWLGWNTGGLVSPGLAALGATAAGFNGLLTGARGVYDWGNVEGWAAFLSDSSWGLLGTTAGDIGNIYALVSAPSSYRPDLSHRQNRQVYDRGWCIRGSAVFTQGNTISNLQGKDHLLNDRVLNHETVHILQNRLFGPFFVLSYAAWLVGGGVVGLILAPFVGENVGQAITDVAYSDNPWERWGYAHGGKDTQAGKLAW